MIYSDTYEVNYLYFKSIKSRRLRFVDNFYIVSLYVLLSKVTWQYCDDKGIFNNFPDMVNYEIECASTAPNKTAEWKFKGEKFKFDFEKSIQEGVGKDGFRKIKRKGNYIYGALSQYIAA